MLAASSTSSPKKFEALPALGLAYLLARQALEFPLLVVVASEDRAAELATDLRALGVADACHFRSSTHSPFEELAYDAELAAERFAVRARCCEQGPAAVTVVSITALQGRWLAAQEFKNARIELRAGEEIERDHLLLALIRAGYQRVSMVEDEGTFAVRGSIIDLFAPGATDPLRVDLFGDEIVSLKSFDPATQRSFGAMHSCRLYPIREVVFGHHASEQAKAWLLAMAEEIAIPSRRLRAMLEDIDHGNYFFGIEALWPAFHGQGCAIVGELVAGCRVVLEEPDELETRAERWWNKAYGDRQAALERGQPVVDVDELVVPAAEVLTLLRASTMLETATLLDERDPGRSAHRLEDWSVLAREMQARRQDSSLGEILEPFAKALDAIAKRNHDALICCQARGQAERVAELLRARGLDLPLLDEPPAAEGLGGAKHTIAICVAGLSAGLYDRDHGIALFSDIELLEHADSRPRRRRRGSVTHKSLSTLKSLKHGDLVVHVDHGIGIYQGLERLVFDGVDGDYVHLEYADGDKLYLPVFRLNLLQPYQGSTDSARLDKLGGTRWQRAKQRVRDGVLVLAHELLANQARRKMRPGFKLPEPDAMYREFEGRFPFEETPDQAKAIEEVVGDLTSGPPMDRLIVGDVGFGKTEVAMRAAFLAANAGKQVAVLVPTTVLAEQHGNRFGERFKGFPIRIEVLSRFRSPDEVRAITQALKNGRVDIVIGTHRLLSSDVGFRDLGLLVIDEEQRFGVRQKERIKQLRAEVHILALSATPIPRTLHMATVGLRDLSLIQSPPTARTSIRTEITRFDEAVVAEAIRRELKRGGQVFVVHNRVSSIDPLAELVKREVPEARVVVAHGQMKGSKLEQIMVDFVRREFNVLVTTAIIESGLDIPTVNTMIVDRADQFGLGQLHQLRGRIGRGKDRAFAYLLLPRGERVRRDALERLQVLRRFSELGSGFQIASQDLETRGAGDLLGKSQSGHIAAVGYELYTELLAEAVERARGEHQNTEVEPEIKLPVTAVLPEKYLPDSMLRLEFYQRMATATSDEMVFDVLTEIEERYGKVPVEVDQLAEVMVLRRRLQGLGASHLTAALVEGSVKISLTFVDDPPLDRGDLVQRAEREPNRYRLLASGKLGIIVSASCATTSLELVRIVRHEIGRLKGLSPVL